MPGIADSWWVSQKQLDDDQKAAWALGKDKSHLILGPPGSGKTNLLLLRAEYLVKAKQPNLRLLVFNRNLQEFIRQGNSREGLSSDCISTHVLFFKEILWQHGVEIVLPNDFDEMRAELCEQVKKLIKKKGLENSYQVLLLDEVQDYTSAELSVFAQLATKIFAAGDFRQQVYNANSSLNVIQKLVDSVTTLKYHYRNGQSICRLADGIMSGRPDYIPMLPSSKYDEADLPSTVTRSKHKTLEDQCQQVVAELTTQLRAYDGELLGIVCPRRDALETMWGILKMSPLRDLITYQRPGEYEAFDTEKPICLCSLQSAKGLEFRTLHIVGADLLKKAPLLREKAYMAVTRAKTSLSIYTSGALIGPWEASLANMAPVEPEPTLADIFGEDE
jgi:superfamily I DNA/RNA helicase